ncbi:MAG: NAD(P)/FAD-dependent oxidoreductase [Holosporales bacterium]|nr:NAD(P)/FAD-dependent oxidoreductase [Holosporales bacterium]
MSVYSDVNVAILGAGVAGLYASYCCGISAIDCAIIDSSMIPGGQCSSLYPDKKVYGVPGFCNITSREFIGKLTDQCFSFGCKKLFGYTISNISKDAELFVINNDIKAKYIIIATGIGNTLPRIPQTIEGLDTLDPSTGFLQHYCMKIDTYKGKEIVIAGGGDSAVDFVIDITPIAKKVTLIHRRAEFTCERAKLNDLANLEKSGRLVVVTEHSISKLEEKNGKGTITAKDKNANEVSFDANHVVFCYGFITSCNATFGLESLGLQIDNNLIKVNLNTMETSIENCYAIGDVVTYENKKKNIVPCFFEADRVVRMIKNKE